MNDQLWLKTLLKSSSSPINHSGMSAIQHYLIYIVARSSKSGNLDITFISNKWVNFDVSAVGSKYVRVLNLLLG